MNMLNTRLALICAAAALLSTFDATAQGSLTPLPGFGTNGWLAPGSSPYLSNTNTERGLAFNPVTGNLVLVSRQSVSGVTNNVRILSGATGADLGGLDPTGITGGTFAVNQAGVTDDGAIYVANLSTTATAAFKVYKWDSESIGLTTPPSVAFNAVTGVARTGDAFAVTGVTGGNPAIFAAAGSTPTATASNFVVGSLDATNSVTAYTTIAGTSPGTNDYRLGLTFVDQTTLIGNQGANARRTTFDPVTVTATLTDTVPLGGVSRRALDYAVIGTTPVLAVLDSNSSTVTVFDLTNPSAPVQIATGNATSGTLSTNANGTGAVAWGPITGNTAVLYAMNSNQGVQAFQFTYSPSTVLAYGTGCDGLIATNLGLPSVGNNLFEIQVTNVPVVSPIAFVAFGSVVVDPGIDLTVIGMAGCFGYTSFDLGLYATAPVIGGVGSFVLPIPNNPTLVGSSLAAQGVSLSLTTALSLASSNGLSLTIGL